MHQSQIVRWHVVQLGNFVQLVQELGRLISLPRRRVGAGKFGYEAWVLVKRILRKYGYPPDKQERATLTVLEQAEVLSANWAIA
jgi:hypothetical protein